MIERVGETLHAAGLDEDARQRVQVGTLQRDCVTWASGPAPARDRSSSSPRTSPAKKRAPKGKAASKKDTAPKREQDREARRRAEREHAEALKAARAPPAATPGGPPSEPRARTGPGADRAADALNGAEAELERAHGEADATAAAHQAAAAELRQLSRADTARE